VSRLLLTVLAAALAAVAQTPSLSPPPPAASPPPAVTSPVETAQASRPSPPNVPARPPSSAPPLMLEEVLESVVSQYPVLLAAIQERAMAEGKALGAQGAFDTKLSAKSEMNQFGFYKNRTNGAEVSQPLRNLGGEVFGGYKRGQGNFGPWEEDLLSLSGGEWSGGIRLPLFRNREIDERRTDLLIAELSITLANASIEKQRLKLFETAAKFYWEWASAGLKLQVAEALLQIAEERIQQVEEFVDAGQVAAIEVVDNRRAIFQRRSAVVSAERALQNAAFELSLFYRGDDGQPRIAPRERLPQLPEPALLTPERIEADLMRALDIRPEILGTEVEQQQSDAALKLAQNQMKPEIDVSAQYGRDNGTGSITKRGSEFIAGLTLKTPFQRRKAKGEMAIQEAKLAQLDQKLRFARDRVSVEVRDAVSALEAAFQRLELTRLEAEAARQLAEAERERFELGDSTLFVVNLRELSAADARLKVITSLAEYHKAMAVYRAATVDW